MLNEYPVAVELLKQACRDIESYAEEIIGKMDNPSDLDITISFSNNEYPTITIRREHSVKCTSKIEKLIMENI